MTCHDVLTHFWASHLKGPVLSALPLYVYPYYSVGVACIAVIDFMCSVDCSLLFVEGSSAGVWLEPTMSVTVAGVRLEPVMSVTVAGVRLEPMMSVTVAGVRLEPMMSVTLAGVRLEPMMSVAVAGVRLEPMMSVTLAANSTKVFYCHAHNVVSLRSIYKYCV